MKTTSFRFIRRVSTALVIILLVASCADAALAQDRSGQSKGPSRGKGGSGSQSGTSRQVSVPVVKIARQGQSGGSGNAGGGITGVTRVTRMSENNQNARDFFQASGLRLP